jgi:hypothetical protein
VVSGSTDPVQGGAVYTGLAGKAPINGTATDSTLIGNGGSVPLGINPAGTPTVSSMTVTYGVSAGSATFNNGAQISFYNTVYASTATLLIGVNSANAAFEIYTPTSLYLDSNGLYLSQFIYQDGTSPNYFDGSLELGGPYDPSPSTQLMVHGSYQWGGGATVSTGTMNGSLTLAAGATINGSGAGLFGVPVSTNILVSGSVSRSFGTIYQNSGPLSSASTRSVIVDSVVSSTGSEVNCYVGATSPPTNLVATQSMGTTTATAPPPGVGGTMTFFVPQAWYYQCTTFTPTGGTTPIISAWTELY